MYNLTSDEINFISQYLQNSQFHIVMPGTSQDNTLIYLIAIQYIQIGKITFQLKFQRGLSVPSDIRNINFILPTNLQIDSDNTWFYIEKDNVNHTFDIDTLPFKPLIEKIQNSFDNLFIQWYEQRFLPILQKINEQLIQENNNSIVNLNHKINYYSLYGYL